MKIKDVALKYNLTESTIRNWIKIGLIPDKMNFSDAEIQVVLSKKNPARRIKKISTDFSVPRSYVKEKKTVDLIEKIIHFQTEVRMDSNSIMVFVIKNVLAQKFSNSIQAEVLNVFGEVEQNSEFERMVNKTKLNYDKEEDFLGSLYSSLISVGKKSTNGVYYTPYNLVENMVNSIEDDFILSKEKILDPACGSGNFLISIVNKMKSLGIKHSEIIDLVYGYDIDPVATLLAKINIYLLLDDIEFSKINIYKMDYIMSEFNTRFSLIIGNPPWGIKFSDQYKVTLRKKMYFKASKQDSFSLFIEKSLNLLNEGGQLFFVLPEAFLNVNKHEPIRNKLLQYKLISIDTMGREFSEVVTKILTIRLKNEKISNSDYYLSYNNTKVNQKTFFQNPSSALLIVDNQYAASIIKKINNHNHRNLKDNVKYALGIVTGNNKFFLSNTMRDGYEPICTGKNLERYFVNSDSIDKYIEFKPELYQQVAPEEMYRHNSRILYNFVGEKIKFSYDDEKILTLNSANIICLYEGWNPYFVIAILNSRITGLYYKKIFRTYKLLRKQVESFKILEFDNETKEKISNYSKAIIEQKQLDNYEKIEQVIYQKLNLTVEEIDYLKSEISL